MRSELEAEGSRIENLIPIDMACATDKQRSMGRVSLHDHRSPLGKVLTAHRSKNQQKRMRKRMKQRYGA